MRFGTIGRSVEDEVAAKREQNERTLRAARIDAARRTRLWEEIADDLVERAPGRFVSASTDRVYTLVRGEIWEMGKAAILADRQPVSFIVDGDHIRCYEREPSTWSEQIRRRELRRGRAGR